MDKTLKEYDLLLLRCQSIFEKKTKDYGTAWRILRPTSLTDQIFIKARRIRSIEEKGVQKVNESVDNEYIGIVNYCIMAMIQLEMGADSHWELTGEEALVYYKKYSTLTRELMIAKNHDYGEVWRDMRISSMTDLILMKLLRIKQIEDNKGVTLISEGLTANYQDIMNYALFSLIKLSE